MKKTGRRRLGNNDSGATPAVPLEAGGTNHGLILLCICFLLSGFAALVYQVAWQRVLMLSVGADVVASTLVVAAFMAGLGFGSLAGGRLAKRLSLGRCLLGFAACEAGIAMLAGASIPFYHGALYRAALGWELSRSATFLLLFIAMLPPTALMGMSLPLLGQAAPRRIDQAGGVLGLLYGINALGAALGAWIAGFFLMGSLGIDRAVWIGMCFNGIAALVSFRVWHLGWGRVASPPSIRECGPGSESSGAEGAGGSLAFWPLVYAGSGFIGLSLEIVWFRIIDIVLKSNSYTFSQVVGLYIGCLALGSLLGACCLARIRSPGRWFLWLQWATTVYCAVGVVALKAYLRTDPAISSYLAGVWGLDVRRLLGAFRVSEPGSLAALGPLLQLYVAFPVVLMGPATVAMGFGFPLIQKHVQDDPKALGAKVGLLQAANIAGSTVGVLLTGLLLLEVVGTIGVLRLLLALGAVAAMAAARCGGPAASSGVLSGVAVALSMALAAALPGSTEFFAALHATPPALAILDESSSCVCLLRDGMERGTREVLNNGKGESRLPPSRVHLALGLLAVLTHPEPKEVAVIGLGCGGTAYAAAVLGSRSRVTCVEICASNLAVVRKAARTPGCELLDALVQLRGVALVAGDGRQFLAASRGGFDVIEIDALWPTASGSGNLYSQEFFELCRDRLKPGGLFCCWVPTARVRRTLGTVFRYGYEGAGASVASMSPVRIDAEQILERLHQPSVQAHLRRGGIDPKEFETHLRDFPIHTWAEIGVQPTETDVNLDLRPKDEFFLNN